MATIYTLEEKKYMFMRQVSDGLSGRQTRDHFAADFPERPIQSLTTIQRVILSFNDRGSINGHNEAPRVSINFHYLNFS